MIFQFLINDSVVHCADLAALPSLFLPALKTNIYLFRKDVFVVDTKSEIRGGAWTKLFCNP